MMRSSHYINFRTVVAATFIAMLMAQGASAQISNEYSIAIQSLLYTSYSGQGTEITRSEFIDRMTSSTVDADNGVAGPITLPFPFTYNNQLYTQIYVCVNGWISFQDVGAIAPVIFTDDPASLFSSTYPNLTVAPYFGDHYLRQPGFDGNDPDGNPYTPSTIHYVSIPATGSTPARFVIEWENLNINYRFDINDPDNPFAPVANVKPHATSVGTFQLHLIQADPNDPLYPGCIEFHYGAIGSTTAPGFVKTSQASVGIEDDVAIPGGATAFINAYEFNASGQNLNNAITNTTLTTSWPPSGFPGRAFVFCRQAAVAGVAQPDAVAGAVRCFPRPANDELQIDGMLVAGSPMTLRSMDGTTVLSGVATGTGHEGVRVAELPSGVYLLEMETKQGYVIERVVIVR
jgi:hypothetical protein